MRIISGVLKGRKITGYEIEGTRPTMDRVRESLFSMIQNNIQDGTILDLFSGTGVLGLESLSNGAKYCYFNDFNKKCIDNIKKLSKEFNIEDKVYLTNQDYKKVLSFYKDKNISFNIIFLDPPYKLEVVNEIIDFIISNNILKEDGLIIVEVDNNYLKDFNELKLIRNKKYGSKYIYIYQK